MENEDVQGIGSLDKFQQLIERKTQAMQAKESKSNEKKAKRMILKHTDSGFPAYTEEKTVEDPLLAEALN